LSNQRTPRTLSGLPDAPAFFGVIRLSLCFEASAEIETATGDDQLAADAATVRFGLRTSHVKWAARMPFPFMPISTSDV
jgi:hypothetical protein